MVNLMDDFMASEEKGLLESRIGFLVLRACKVFILLILSKVCEFMPVYSIHYISYVSPQSIFALSEEVPA